MTTTSLPGVSPYRGFTLIELLVVIAITMLLGTALLANYRSFTDSATLSSEAYDVALALREAQTLGISTRGSDIIAGARGSYAAYGFVVDTRTPSNVYLFAKPTVGTAWNPGTDKIITVYTLPVGYTITAICGSTNGIRCDRSLIQLSAVFIHPVLDANLTQGEYAFSFTRITLTSPRGKTKQVEIWTTGQIQVL